MAEQNGHGRLDRIEAILENLAERQDKLFTTQYLHDERLTRIENTLEEILVMDKVYRKQSEEREKRLDERIANLVTAIRELVKQRRQ